MSELDYYAWCEFCGFFQEKSKKSNRMRNCSICGKKIFPEDIEIRRFGIAYHKSCYLENFSRSQDDVFPGKRKR